MAERKRNKEIHFYVTDEEWKLIRRKMIESKTKNIYAISKRLGHSDLTTTTRRYAYLIDELRQKADDDIENILNNVGIETSHRIAE